MQIAGNNPYLVFQLSLMQHMLLLHGALGSAKQLQPLANALNGHYIVHTFNFSGHGGRPFAADPFSIALFSNEIKEYMHEHAIDQVAVFGYSMGGYAAMYLAKHFPGKISKLVTLATKWHWDEAIAAREIKMLNADTICEKTPAFAMQLEQRHAPNDWKVVMEKTAALLTALGKQNALQPDDYTTITIPCLLLLGDRDKMVTAKETLAVSQKLPAAQFSLLPDTPHPFEQVDISLLAGVIKNFIGMIA
jgi:pimeloyl-ACP methyl ester carboxylesterase